MGSSRQYLPIAPEELKCPLCLKSSWTSQRKFVTHLGRHMEDIALASLPTDVGSDSNAGSDSDSGSGSELEANSERSKRLRDSQFRAPNSHDIAPIADATTGPEKISSEVQGSQSSARSSESIKSALNEDPTPRIRKFADSSEHHSESEPGLLDEPGGQEQRLSNKLKPPGKYRTPKRTTRRKAMLEKESTSRKPGLSNHDPAPCIFR
jgi:hypothetical protein